MKLYLLLAFFFVFGIVSAQEVYIPDPIFKSKLLAASPNNNIAGNAAGEAITIDSNANGQIEVSECLNVAGLGISQSPISDLTGINAFVNLKVLVCTMTSLTSLDVSGLHSLELLQCFNNQLVSLNVSNLSHLETLFCYENAITTLNLSGCSALKTLFCNDNDLTQLNLNGLNSLEKLDCYRNALTTLDVSDQPNLKNLDCGQNHLTSLVSNSLQNLLTLTCSSNQLNSINLSDAVNLTHLDCGNNLFETLNLVNLGQLILLVCDRNFLTELDLSHQPNLGYLNCSRNNLATLDCSHQSHLALLYCFNNALTSLYIKNGAVEQDTSFSGNPNLTFICADTAQVTAVAALAVQNGNLNCVVNDNCTLSTAFFNPAQAVTLYPNPVADFIHVEWRQAQVISVDIYNLLGQLVLSKPDSPNTVDVSMLHPGNYFIAIRSGDFISKARFTKQ